MWIRYRFSIRWNESTLYGWTHGIYNRPVEYSWLHIQYVLCDMDWITVYVVVFSAGGRLIFSIKFFTEKQQKKCLFCQRDAAIGLNPWYPREQWDPFDPMLLSEGVFAAGMIFSFLKLVHIFSINPHLGPLQVSLGSMFFIRFMIISLRLHKQKKTTTANDFSFQAVW